MDCTEYLRVCHAASPVSLEVMSRIVSIESIGPGIDTDVARRNKDEGNVHEWGNGTWSNAEA